MHFQVIGVVTSDDEQPFHLQGHPEAVVRDFEAASPGEAMQMFLTHIEATGAEVLAITGVGQYQ